MRVFVLADVADIAPVTRSNIPEQRLIVRQQRGEKVLREVDFLIVRNVIPDGRLQDIDPRVHSVRENLSP